VQPETLSEMGLVLILNIIIYVNYFWVLLIREKRTRWTDSTGLN
jgi:preprotein translocase subunit YajC